MEYVTLNNGVKVSKTRLGVMQMTDPVASENAIVTALEMGYPMIDIAAAYGNEAIVGRAVKRANVNREDIFVTSEPWISDISYEGAKRGLEKSLENLQLDYIDLYVLHQPIGDLYGTWRYLTEVYKEGRIRAIGVDNFTLAKLVESIKFNDVKPAVNLIQANPYHQRQDDLQAMVKRDAQMIAWQSFAGGDGNLSEDAVLKAIADKYHKTIGQVILCWLTQRDIVVIPKSSSPERQAENLAIFDFSLSQEDMETIKKLDQDGGFVFPENADQFERLLNMWEQFFG